jgi:hypothetical protein
MKKSDTKIIDFPKVPEEVRRVETAFLKGYAFARLLRELLKRDFEVELAKELSSEEYENLEKGIQQIGDDLAAEMESCVTQAIEIGVSPEIHLSTIAALKKLDLISAPNLVLVRDPNPS